MCGIAGVIGIPSQSEGSQAVSRMNRTIMHRGPDDEGCWAQEGVAIGVRRLSIIDLAGGHQPMRTAEGVAIVFNGEIYNYRALRSSLEERGRRFHTQSDTEVVLAVYCDGGVDAFSQLQGMFAICIVDARTGRVHLVRDRLGVKPLYYAEEGGRLYFASEVKAILAAMERKPALNETALHHYLTLRYVPGPETIWRGIFKLPPGHTLELDVASHKTSLRQWWGVSFFSEPVDPDRRYGSEFEQLFLESVEKRLVAADVPVGVMLSGGVDSSSVGAAAIEMGHRDFHTFSVGFEQGGPYSELPYARQVAAHIGSRHHEVVVDQDGFLDFLPEMVWYSDEPLADLSSVPLHFVSQLAREHVKVVLSGEGSDEVLAGYDLERMASRLDRLKPLDQPLVRSALRAAARALPPGRFATLSRAVGLGGWSGYLKARASHMTWVWDEPEKRALWRSNGFPSTADLVRSWYDLSPSPHPLDQLQQVYCHSWLVEDLLMKADKMSMAASLELRVPFLDHRLVEWAATLPLSWKVGDAQSGYRSKRILRDFARRRLPAGIVERPKQGFPVPASEWLRGKVGCWARSQLRPGAGPLDSFFDPEVLAGVLDRARAGDMASADKVWVMVVLQLWMRRWL